MKGDPSVASFIHIKPVIEKWSDTPLAKKDIEEFTREAVTKPWLYLTPEQTRTFARYFHPVRIEKHIRNIKAILLSPAGMKVSNDMWHDPMGIEKEILTYLTLPIISTAKTGLFICVWGTSHVDSLRAAEKIDNTIKKLHNRESVGAYFSAAHIFCSQSKQRIRYDAYENYVDVAKWWGDIARNVQKEGIDQRFFKNTKTYLNSLDREKKHFYTLDEQRRHINSAVSNSLDKYLLPHIPAGYCAVIYVTIPPDGDIKTLYDTLSDAIDTEENPVTITSPSYLSHIYMELVTRIQKTFIFIWVCGIVILLSTGYTARVIRRRVRHCLPGEDIITFDINPDRKQLLGDCGFTSFTDFMTHRERGKRSTENKNTSSPQLIHKEITANLTRQNVSLILSPYDEDMPNAERIKVRIERAWGKCAYELEKEYKNMQRIQAHGLVIPECVAYGSGYIRSLRCAFYIIACPPESISLRHWQERLKTNATIKKSALCASAAHSLASLLSTAHQKGIYNLPCNGDTIYIQPENDKKVSVYCMSFRGARRISLFARMISVFSFNKVTKICCADLARANSALFPAYLRFKSRIAAYCTYTGRHILKSKDRKRVAYIRTQSYVNGYEQYAHSKTGNSDHDFNRAASKEYENSAIHSIDGAREITGTRMTTKRERTVERFVRNGITFYIKRHTKDTQSYMFRNWFRNNTYRSQARDEWNALIKMEEMGIPSVVPVSMGTQYSVTRYPRFSYIITRELENGYSLEEWLHKQTTIPVSVRRKLARDVAHIARRLHKEGYVHRDFYLGHIYIVGDPYTEYTLHLLDMQRVKKGAKIGNRWSVKDICALYFSAYRIPCINSTDYMRFLHAYMGVSKCNRPIKLFIYRIMRKADKVARHTEKLLARRRARGELPPVDST